MAANERCPSLADKAADRFTLQKYIDHATTLYIRSRGIGQAADRQPVLSLVHTGDEIDEIVAVDFDASVDEPLHCY